MNDPAELGPGQHQNRGRLAVVGDIDDGVIEFNLDGSIMTPNVGFAAVRRGLCLRLV